MPHHNTLHCHFTAVFSLQDVHIYVLGSKSYSYWRWVIHLMSSSKGSKFVRTEHQTESNLEPFNTGSSRTGTLLQMSRYCIYVFTLLLTCSGLLSLPPVASEDVATAFFCSDGIGTSGVGVLIDAGTSDIGAVDACTHRVGIIGLAILGVGKLGVGTLGVGTLDVGSLAGTLDLDVTLGSVGPLVGLLCVGILSIGTCRIVGILITGRFSVGAINGGKLACTLSVDTLDDCCSLASRNLGRAHRN